MNSMIRSNLQEDEVLDSFTYKWLEDLNQKTIKKLAQTLSEAKKKLLDFIENEKIKTSNSEKLADLIINIWIRGKQAIDMLKNISYDTDRSALADGITKAKESIAAFRAIQNTCAMMSVLDVDLKTSFDFDSLIKVNEEFITYAEFTLSQSFQRGKSPISIDNIQELTIFTLFYIGEELLQLKNQRKPSPLYQLIKILINIHDGSNGSVLGEEKIYRYYKQYSDMISAALEQKIIESERLGVKYSLIEYQDGLNFKGSDGVKTEEYFLPRKTNERVIKLLKFIYYLKIPDHKITMSIFDYSILTEIIQLTA